MIRLEGKMSTRVSPVSAADCPVAECRPVPFLKWTVGPAGRISGPATGKDAKDQGEPGRGPRLRSWPRLSG